MYDGTENVADVVKSTFEMGYSVDRDNRVRTVNFGEGLIESTVQLYLRQWVDYQAVNRTIAGIFIPSFGNTDYSDRLYVRMFPNADIMDETNIARVSKSLPYKFDIYGRMGHYIL